MSRLARKVYLVCYDISADERRTRVYKRLRGAGEHLQASVFRCVLSELQLAVLVAELEGLIDAQTDQVLFVTLGTEDNARAWTATVVGRPLAPPDRHVRVL